jgi:hypothetical protein
MVIGAYLTSILLCLLASAIFEGRLIRNLKYDFSNFIKNNLKTKTKMRILDPNGLLDAPSMSLEAKTGHKVTVTKESIKNGSDYDRENAAKYLEVGKVYTVEDLDVHDWSSSVILQEIPNQEFNSVHIIDEE